MDECSPEEIEALLKRAQRERLVPEHRAGSEKDREWISARLPHRDPLLLLDRVNMIDLEAGFISASYELSRAADVLSGHFPGFPTYPGLLQIEAIGQAGILLGLEKLKQQVSGVKLTHVIGARFMRPVGAKGVLEISARTFEDGFFMTIVGQTIYEGEICSAAAVAGLT